MANWNGLVMTDKGIALQSKVQAGEVLNITKMKLGSGTLPAETDIRKLTDLIKPEQNLSIGGREPNGDYCKISATISNVGLEAGYYVRELGVFAQDPDDGEILYAYTTDGAPDYLPAEGGSTVISQEFSVNIAVSDTDKINVEIDPGALATMGYVQLQIDEHNEDAAAHEQAFSQHNTDETAHYDMTGATGSKAGKRGFVPAPKAGDQNKALFGNGTYKQVVETINNIKPGSDNDVDLHLKFFSSLEQIGLNKSDATPKDIAEILPDNSILQFYAANVSTSNSYVPNLVLPTSGLIRVNKVTNNNVAIKFSIIDANGYMYRAVYHAEKGFTGWKETATTDILPTGTILPFAGSTIPTGFLACNGAAVSRTTYAALFAVIGTTYGVGNGSTTFNLPKADDNRFLEFSNTLGTLKNAGLPNIIGQLDTGGETALFYAQRINGAFSNKSSTTLAYGAPAGSVNSNDRSYQVGFDASKSNSIYGSSNTVQPKSLTVKAIIKY